MRPKTCYCQQQSSQYPIFPSQARDLSFTRVARNETKYQKILDAADFAIRENCSFIRLNDVFRKTLLKAAKKKTLSQPTMRAEISLIRALISNCHTERIMGSYEKHFFFFFLGGGGGGGEYVNSQSETHQTLSTVANPLPIKQIKSNLEK